MEVSGGTDTRTSKLLGPEGPVVDTLPSGRASDDRLLYYPSVLTGCVITTYFGEGGQCI